MISAPHTTESLVEGREELKAILAGVQQLPDDRREALIMRFALGMDNREIARALGRTDGATKVLLHRAIRQLEGIVAETATTATGGEADMSANAADFEALLREALTPVEPPADLAAAPRADARQPDRARPGGARELGAVGDARPAQLGPTRRRGGDRRRRRDGARRAPRPQPPPRAQAAVERPARSGRATLQDIAEEARRILPGPDRAARPGRRDGRGHC